MYTRVTYMHDIPGARHIPVRLTCTCTCTGMHTAEPIVLHSIHTQVSLFIYKLWVDAAHTWTPRHASACRSDSGVNATLTLCDAEVTLLTPCSVPAVGSDPVRDSRSITVHPFTVAQQFYRMQPKQFTCPTPFVYARTVSHEIFVDMENGLHRAIGHDLAANVAKDAVGLFFLGKVFGLVSE